MEEKMENLKDILNEMKASRRIGRPDESPEHNLRQVNEMIAGFADRIDKALCHRSCTEDEVAALREENRVLRKAIEPVRRMHVSESYFVSANEAAMALNVIRDVQSILSSDGLRSETDAYGRVTRFIGSLQDSALGALRVAGLKYRLVISPDLLNAFLPDDPALRIVEGTIAGVPYRTECGSGSVLKLEVTE